MVRRSKQTVDLKLCECGCGQQIPRHDKSRRLRRFAFGHHNKKSCHYAWKGGRFIDYHGYVRIKHHHRRASMGYAKEHVIVFEEVLGCCLLDWGIVHHIDGNKQNNNINNLKGMTRSQHLAYHRPLQRKMTGVCSKCGTTSPVNKDTGFPEWRYDKIDKRLLCKRCYKTVWQRRSELKKRTLSKSNTHISLDNFWI